jgi:hypothetical protein
VVISSSRRTRASKCALAAAFFGACNSFDGPPSGDPGAAPCCFDRGQGPPPVTEPPNFGFDGFLEIPPPEPCDYTQLLATDLEPAFGLAGARFIGFFEEGIIGQLPSGETFLVFWPSGGLVRMAEGDADLRFRDASAGYVLACSAYECALLEGDWTRPGFLRRIPGGTVPGGAQWSWLRWDSFLLCVLNESGAEVCFDRVAWTTDDGGVLVSDSSADAGSPDSESFEAGSDAGFLPSEAGADAGSHSSKSGADASSARDAGAGPGSPPPPAEPECQSPVYCDSPDLSDDPLCLYAHTPSGWLYGVTRAGRMVEANYDGGGTARCSSVTPPFGAPVGLARATCGIWHHTVLLTAEGLYETCGCAYN